jgi:hypothetical protein
VVSAATIMLMREWLTAQPRWVLSLVMGLSFAVLMTLQGPLRGNSWGEAALTGVISGALFGPLMGPYLHRLYRRQTDAVGALDPGTQRAAARAIRRGPVPMDPQVRAAAVRVIDYQLAEMRRRRWLSVVGFVLFMVLSTTLAITQSPWWWLAVAFWVAMAGMALVLPRRLQRRRAQLETS